MISLPQSWDLTFNLEDLCLRDPEVVDDNTDGKVDVDVFATWQGNSGGVNKMYDMLVNLVKGQTFFSSLPNSIYKSLFTITN